MSPRGAPSACAQLAAGTRNSSAPASRAPTIFWGDPADRADGAVGGDLAGAGDVVAAGQRVGREGVVDRQREHEAGVRPADPRVDEHLDVEREVVDSAQGDADPRSVGGLLGSDLDLLALAVAADHQVEGLALGGDLHHVVGGVDLRSR